MSHVTLDTRSIVKMRCHIISFAVLQFVTDNTHHSVFYRPDALPAAQPTASTLVNPELIPNAFENDLSQSALAFNPLSG